ncbi:Zinc finger BED domain-containing protein RICESLEEPER 2 [Linum perenne]
MEVLKIAQRISLTTDLWKSSQTVEYMVVTCHFVDRNWKLQKRILNFCDLPPPHSGISISDALHKCLVEWDIERKIWTITVDNASNNDVATKLPLGGDIFHVRCCAHILNIMVQFGLKEIEGVIENVRQSVKHIAISESRVNMFREVTKQLRLSGKKLILDCCTRWNSTFHMISVALELKDVFPGYAARDPWYKWLPSEEEWQRVSQVCQFLEVFSDVTNIISGSSYTTANVFLPELWRIKVLLKNTMQAGDECMKSMAEKMQEKFDKYWGEYVEEYKAREVENRSEMVVETVASASTDSGKEKKLSGQDMLDSIVRNVSSSAATVKSELEWWKENRLTYKILSRMATEIMAIPITSVASEAAFSAGGRVIEPSRARLGKKTIQALLCSQDWLKNHYGLTRSSKVSFNFLFT